MTKKKKKVVKKKKEKKSPFAKLISEYEPPSPNLFKSIQDNWVLVHIKLMSWTFLNFDLIIPETTHLYIIKQKIMERHGGSICELKLWRDQVNPRFQIHDLNRTLRDVFDFNDSYYSSSDNNGKYKYECTMYYDFKPFHSECPLLLSSPRLTNKI